MAKDRAQRRKYARLKKAKCSKYNTAGARTPAHVGKCAVTPCSCSCHMCGHQRRINGQNMQEQRARARYTD